jgi:hypothetical protein
VAVDWTSGQLGETMQRIGIGAFTDQPDVDAHMAQRARYAELEAYCPALPIAWTTLTILGQALVICTPQLQPLGDPITDGEQLLDVLAETPRAAVGVLTGPRPGYCLVGVRCETWAALHGWLMDTTTTSYTVENSYEQQETRKVGRHCGKFGLVEFQQSARPMMVTMAMTGRSIRAQSEAFARMPSRSDLGGWATWSAVADHKGRLPSFRARRLADGLETLPDGAVLPVWWRDAAGRVAVLESLPVNPEEGEGAPPWFASLLGGRF